MKIHSDKLTSVDIYAAAEAARTVHGQDIYLDEVTLEGSRKRHHGFTVYAYSDNGRYARNGRDGRAATWDAYGYVMAYLYRIDPNAIVGIYKSADDFREQCADAAARTRQYRPADVSKGHSGAFLAVTEVRLDGKTVATLPTDDDAFAWLLRHQGQSVSYALEHAGYSVHTV